MKYKAMMIDVDGTLVPVSKDGVPSARVKKAIATASKIVHVGVASSRPIFFLRHIIKDLRLSGPSIINGGAQVIDVTTDQVYYRQLIEKKDILPVYRIAQKFNVPLIVNMDDHEVKIVGRVPKEEILGMYIPALDPRIVEKLQKAIDTIPTVSTYTTPSWGGQGKLTISTFHVKATKQHAIWEVAKILGITTHEIIGVGDGGNDFPLLMACGLKVAMGNAVDDLKAIADYIAPSVNEDGVADVIEKFILRT